MKRFSLPFASFFFFSFASLGLASCAPCASDNDCGMDSVCLIDADGPRCAPIMLARPVGEGSVDVEILDDDIVNDDDDAAHSNITLRSAITSFALNARAGTIVMRPITVIVTRSPSASTNATTRSPP